MRDVSAYWWLIAEIRKKHPQQDTFIHEIISRQRMGATWMNNVRNKNVETLAFEGSRVAFLKSTLKQFLTSQKSAKLTHESKLNLAEMLELFQWTSFQMQAMNTLKHLSSHSLYPSVSFTKQRFEKFSRCDAWKHSTSTSSTFHHIVK